jgi:purine-nucleoside phosphorylase
MTIQATLYDQAAELIQKRAPLAVKVGIVLGSGLGGLAEDLENRVAIPYEEIPGWPRSTVQGHGGQLVIGRLEGVPVVTQKGRAHFYEGYGLEQVTFPIRVMKKLGVETLILTNAAGGINPSMAVGDVMLINDHINFVGLAGHNPLIGPNDDSFGVRFVPMTKTYDRELRRLAQMAAANARLTLHQGAYACVAGPTFETPAEIRMLRTIGADAVGMSTVHEVIIARHADMRVLAFSGITNVAIDTVDSDDEPNHLEVMDVGDRVLKPKLTQIVRGVLRAL